MKRTSLPLLTTARVHHAARRRGGGVAARGARAAAAMPVIGFLTEDRPSNGKITWPDSTRACGKLDSSSRPERRRSNTAGRRVNTTRLPALAADLVRRKVAVIFAGSIPAIAAARTATTTIPIVFTVGGNPVKEGLVASLNRPGGNVTGVSLFFGELVAKRLELLRELVPKVGLIAVLLNPTNPNADARSEEVHAAARAIGQRIHVFNAGTENEIDSSFATFVQAGAGALLVLDDPLFDSQRDQIVALAARHAVTAIYNTRQFTATGGLMSYGASFADAYRRAGIYVGRILGVRSRPICRSCSRPSSNS